MVIRCEHSAVIDQIFVENRQSFSHICIRRRFEYRLDTVIQTATEMLRLTRGRVLHIVLTAPPAFVECRYASIADAPDIIITSAVR